MELSISTDSLKKAIDFSKKMNVGHGLSRRGGSVATIDANGSLVQVTSFGDGTWSNYALEPLAIEKHGAITIAIDSISSILLSGNTLKLELLRTRCKYSVVSQSGNSIINGHLSVLDPATAAFDAPKDRPAEGDYRAFSNVGSICYIHSSGDVVTNNVQPGVWIHRDVAVTWNMLGTRAAICPSGVDVGDQYYHVPATLARLIDGSAGVVLTESRAWLKSGDWEYSHTLQGFDHPPTNAVNMMREYQLPLEEVFVNKSRMKEILHAVRYYASSREASRQSIVRVTIRDKKMVIETPDTSLGNLKADIPIRDSHGVEISCVTQFEPLSEAIEAVSTPMLSLDNRGMLAVADEETSSVHWVGTLNESAFVLASRSIEASAEGKQKAPEGKVQSYYSE